jgi:hypothetical protein
MRRRLPHVVCAAVAVAALCAPAAASVHAVSPPPVHGRFSYQIGGAFTPGAGVEIVDRDWHDKPARGRYSICYVNAFQTQPAADSWWRKNHPHLLLRDAHGQTVEDAGWPGELLLDTSTSSYRAKLAAIVGGWITSCAQKGYDAVEPDNLDSYSRSRHLLTRVDNYAFAKLLVTRAHHLGLAIAQKNDAQHAAAGRRHVGFDFAIAEECQVYAECGDYRSAYGRHVIEIEYADNARHYFTDACKARGAAISITFRDRDVEPRGHKGHVEKWC